MPSATCRQAFVASVATAFALSTESVPAPTLRRRMVDGAFAANFALRIALRFASEETSRPSVATVAEELVTT